MGFVHQDEVVCVDSLHFTQSSRTKVFKSYRKTLLSERSCL